MDVAQDKGRVTASTMAMIEPVVLRLLLVSAVIESVIAVSYEGCQVLRLPSKPILTNNRLIQQLSK